jgi:hypothetical protein
MLKQILILLVLFLPLSSAFSHSTSLLPVPFANELNNPRGFLTFGMDQWLIIEAGTGKKLGGKQSGKISLGRDINRDGLLSAIEKSVLVDDLVSYNIMEVFNPGRDEVVGPGDGVLLDQRRLIYTRDSGRESTEIVQLDLVDLSEVVLVERPGVINSILLSADQQTLFLAESTLNQIGAYHFESGYEEVLLFDVLENQQQAIPTGLTLDAEGNLIVSLFSGQLWAYYGETISFMPGDAKIAKVDLTTRTYEYIAEGLTTAIDVVTDRDDNIYFLEMTTTWPSNLISRDFDLYNENSPPDPGRYMRNSGRLSVLVAESQQIQTLLENLDLPTNLSLGDQQIFISTGQGTPGRKVWSEQGIFPIEGKILSYRIRETTTITCLR